MATVEDDVDELYALPLDQFTAARNALAKRLKKEGDKEAAATVQTLKKPSVAGRRVAVHRVRDRDFPGLRRRTGAVRFRCQVRPR